MRSFMLFLLSVTPAFADLPIDQREDRERRPDFDQIATPCLSQRRSVPTSSPGGLKTSAQAIADLLALKRSGSGARFPAKVSIAPNPES